MTEYEPAIPKGGRLTHAKIKGGWAAMCGYAPSAPNRFQMKDRSGWRTWIHANHKGITCAKCLAKIEKEKQCQSESKSKPSSKRSTSRKRRSTQH